MKKTVISIMISLFVCGNYLYKSLHRENHQIQSNLILKLFDGITSERCLQHSSHRSHASHYSHHSQMTQGCDNKFLSIKKIIEEEFPNARNVIIEEDSIGNFLLFWSDPKLYIKGPSISVNSKCWKISFSTETYTNDFLYVKAVREHFVYYFSQEDNSVFLRKTYDETNLGVYQILLKDSRDNRYNAITDSLVMDKNEFTNRLEINLKK